MWESMRIWFSHPSHRALLQVSKLIIENCLNRSKNIFPPERGFPTRRQSTHTLELFMTKRGERLVSPPFTRGEVLVQIL